MIKVGSAYPGATGGWIWEHRKVMAEAIGRPLRRGENVHHRNGDRGDNRLENLELWLRSQPPGQRADEFPHCPGCRCSAEGD